MSVEAILVQGYCQKTTAELHLKRKFEFKRITDF